MNIRPMTSEDYDRFVELHNRVYPTRTRTVEEVREAGRTREPKHKAGRWAAFVEDRMIGFAGYAQWTGESHRTWFQVNVVVDEPLRRQGIGTSLYTCLLEELNQHDPKVLRADAYENLPAGLPFALSFGFKDVFREGPSHLDLEPFDAASYAPLLQRLEGEGIEFLSYEAFRERDDGFAEPLYAAYCDAWKDVPKEEESEILRNDWQEWVLEGSQLDFEVSTVALSGDRIVGFCEVGSAPEGRPVYAGLAGVARPDRGRGIATAAYVTAIEVARRKGHPQMQTSSGIGNVAMQTVYRKLGFVRESVWIQLEKRLEEREAPD
ncbi:MAG: GNAT family N-acetyltransferase [Candidatus Bipolaricaulia bacterium]